jgi:hypothetical protein
MSRQARAVARHGRPRGGGPGGDRAQRWLVSVTLRNGAAMLEGGAGWRKGSGARVGFNGGSTRQLVGGKESIMESRSDGSESRAERDGEEKCGFASTCRGDG